VGFSFVFESQIFSLKHFDIILVAHPVLDLRVALPLGGLHLVDRALIKLAILVYIWVVWSELRAVLMLLVEFCSPILVGEVPCDQLMRPLLLRLLCKLVSSSIGSVTLEIRLSHRSLALAAPAILGLVQVGWRLIAVVGIVGKVIPRTLMMVANRLIFV